MGEISQNNLKAYAYFKHVVLWRDNTKATSSQHVDKTSCVLLDLLLALYDRLQYKSVQALRKCQGWVSSV